jgi:hypothetical protein
MTLSARQPYPEIMFSAADQAWLWVAARPQALDVRTAPGDLTLPNRRAAILKCLDQLYRAGDIDLVHGQVLRRWGEIGHAPPYDAASRSDYRIWRDAMSKLEPHLRALHIVTGWGVVACEQAEQRKRLFLAADRNSFLTQNTTSGSNMSAIAYPASATARSIHHGSARNPAGIMINVCQSTPDKLRRARRGPPFSLTASPSAHGLAG